jgi:murein L,D-transpeptidase YafK
MCLLALLVTLMWAPAGATADRVVINKAKRELILFRGTEALRTYRIALGTNPVGPKRRRGDGKTPEGLYTISGRNPRSSYHRSLRISYPSREDRARAARARVDPGGDIMIHGLPNGRGYIGRLHRQIDWTDGCVAVTDDEIEEIWRLVPDGTPVRINP